MRTFYLLFRWLYPFDSLGLRDKKKNLQAKRKNLFVWRFFYLSRGKREGETKRGKTKKEQYTHQQIVIYLVEALLERKSITFYKQGKMPLFYKKQYKKRKSKGKGITSEKTLKKKNLFEIFLSEVMPGKEKEPSS